MVLLVGNILFGAMLSFYNSYNVIFSSVAIIATGILLYLTDIIHLKDGYKVSLMVLFAIVGVMEFILSLIAPNRMIDNWWFVIVVILIALEVILLIITNTVTNKTK